MASHFEMFSGTVFEVTEDFCNIYGKDNNEDKIEEIAKKYKLNIILESDLNDDSFLVIKDGAGKELSNCVYDLSFYNIKDFYIREDLEERCLSFLKELNETLDLDLSLDITPPYVCAKIIPKI